MSDFMFDEFEAVSAKQWKQKIQFDLKGADYNDTLVWQSLEGIHVKPFYHQDDFPNDFLPIPGQPSQWNIGQFIFIDAPEIANKLALDAVDRGATAIYFSVGSSKVANHPHSDLAFEFQKVFQDFPFEKATIYFNFQFLKSDFISNLITFFSEKKATVFYNLDPLGHLARTGNWFYNQKTDSELLEKIMDSNAATSLLGIDTTLYENAGANKVQQLAYALAHVNEYLTTLDLRKQKVTFEVSVGTNYFFEIAKIRALRKLYAALANEYEINPNCHIIARPSKRNKTLYDYNLNMLRTTTECMSAIIGGADTICNIPYDGLYHKSNEFGERIARNQLLILKSESYFDMVSNVGDGSYYIESLTDELAQKALELFKDIERNGGFLQQLKQGILQKKIKESAKKEQQLFDDGTLVLVGTNKYRSDVDRMKDELELYPFVKRNPRQTVIAPILENRLAETSEQERLSHE
ncbi:MAG: methylmalonyl-CoA mutase subunit beta [Bacteroidota bacterium]